MFFDVLRGRAGQSGRAGRAGTPQIAKLKPWPRRHRPLHAGTQLHTQACNATATAAEIEIDFPVGTTPQPPILIICLIVFNSTLIVVFFYSSLIVLNSILIVF